MPCFYQADDGGLVATVPALPALPALPAVPTGLAPSHARFLQRVAAELLLRDPDGSRLQRIGNPQALAREAAEQAVDTAGAWETHLGACYDVDGVRALLSREGRLVSKQAVSKRKGLLSLTTGSGHVVYPAFQFNGGAPTAGLDAVLNVLPETLVSRWTVASWLVSPQAALGGDIPITVLQQGSQQVVVDAARRWARSLLA